MTDKIKLKADINNFGVFIGFIEDFFTHTGIDKNLQLKLLTACEEVIINVLKYAYPKDKGDLEITVSDNTDSIEFIFEDSGVQFNPLEHAEADVDKEINDREQGGLGIFMVKKMMDEVTYKNVDNKNILTIKKIINV